MGTVILHTRLRTQCAKNCPYNQLDMDSASGSANTLVMTAVHLPSFRDHTFSCSGLESLSSHGIIIISITIGSLSNFLLYLFDSIIAGDNKLLTHIIRALDT